MATGNTHEDVLLSLRQIIRAVDLHSRRLVHDHGLTGPQLLLLRALERLGEVPVGELARDVSLSHATVTGVLDRLEKRGLVQRTRSEEDKRKVLVSTTESGLVLLADAPSLLPFSEATKETVDVMPSQPANPPKSTRQSPSPAESPA